jgi:hypothetical protein
LFSPPFILESGPLQSDSIATAGKETQYAKQDVRSTAHPEGQQEL